MELTILGSGTSQGVPVIACECDVCQSIDPRDNRSRTSLLITIDGKNIAIDSGPDFRTQMLREKVMDLEGIVFTHEHKDHVAGLDDVRAFNYRRKNQEMDIFASKEVQKALKREFSYVFSGDDYPGIPKVKLHTIDKDPFIVSGVEFTPIDVMHYKMPVKGFRVKDAAYVTDANFISDKEKEKLKGLKVLILNALRKEKHISHFNLEEALELIAELKPQRAYLTHLSHLMGKHIEIEDELPKGVYLAYDGMKINL